MPDFIAARDDYSALSIADLLKRATNSTCICSTRPTSSVRPSADTVSARPSPGPAQEPCERRAAKRRAHAPELRSAILFVAGHPGLRQRMARRPCLRPAQGACAGGFHPAGDLHVRRAQSADLRDQGRTRRDRHPWEASYTFPTNLIGGGFPLIVRRPGTEHVASVGCLVTDGHRTYALTNRHVAGDPGTPIHSLHRQQPRAYRRVDEAHVDPQGVQ